jgi:hypothetical protein
VKIYNTLVIVTPIWQKLNNIEHKKTLIVRNFWQLFSHIFGETLLIVTNIWRNHVWDDNIFDFQIPLSQGLWISEVRNVIAPIRSDLANCLMVSK